jgi:CheY-like chemotaxis protein
MTQILLIEDNELNRDMLARRLARRGYEVLTAADGAEGLALTVTEEPDLILLDLRLPVVDGWQVARQLKADPAIRWIPILALTAHAIAGDRERALDAGCDEYETKPVDFDRLLEKIGMLLGELERER